MDASDWNITLSIILTIMLIISEALGWADCKANAITQLYKCYHCASPPSPVIPARSSSLPRGEAGSQTSNDSQAYVRSEAWTYTSADRARPHELAR